jgi:protoporphyrinogen oxidase
MEEGNLNAGRRAAIIGAGVAGLSAAYDLARSGWDVTIFESSQQAGGLASGFKQAHWEWSVEKYYHHWFASDKHMLGLIHELGWSQNVIFRRPYTVVYYQGKFYPFDSIIKGITFPGLGWGINKIRFGLVGLYLRMTNNWRPLEEVTVEAWMRRRAGDRVYELIWEPLLVGKFGERYSKQVNMAWMWARLKARTTRLGTYKGGFQAFADQFASFLMNLGVKIKLGEPVERIICQTGPGLTISAGQAEEKFDYCLATTSPGLLARLAPEMPGDYLKGLLELKSMGAVVLVLALKQRLSEEGYYWFNLPKSAGYPYLALVEHTNFLSPEYFGGDHIIYIGDYLEPGHEYFSLGEDEILGRFMPSLSKFNPDFHPDWIRDSWLFRTNYAQPVPLLSHSGNIPEIKTPLPGLYFASMSQVYPWDRGTNFAVEIGRKAAGMMVSDCERS